MRYLLDANIISALVVQPQGSVARRIGEVGEESVFTSIIVSAEIAFGLRKRGSEELTRRVGNVLGRLFVASFDPSADRHYADIRLELQREGRIIGPNDLWIAAHARATEAVLVTGNDREFSRVSGLVVENWLRQ